MPGTINDRARVADKWSEALQASEGWSESEALEVAARIIDHGTRILAAIALADGSPSGKDARWLRDVGTGAIELIVCGAELILRDRVTGSDEGDGEDSMSTEGSVLAPDQDPRKRAVLILHERSEVLDFDREPFLPLMGEANPDRLGERMNPTAYPPDSELTPEERAIRAAFQGEAKVRSIDSWEDVVFAWIGEGDDQLLYLIGSVDEQVAWWLAGIGALVLFAEGRAASFSSGLEALASGVDLDIVERQLDPSGPEGSGGESGALGQLESLAGVGSLLASIDRVRNFDLTATARKDRKLLRRAVPLSVVVSSESNQALDPRVAAMAYAKALELLAVADAPQELESAAASRLFKELAAGDGTKGSYVVNFEDLTSVVAEFGSDSDPQGDRDDVANQASSSFLDEFARGLREKRDEINITFFDRAKEAEQLVGGKELLRLAISDVLTVEELSREELDSQVTRAFEEAQYELSEKSVKAISHTLVEMSARSGLTLDERLDGIVDRCAVEHGTRVGSSKSSGGELIEDEDHLKFLDEVDVEVALRETVIDAREAEECLADLDALVGLESVKEAMRSVLIAARAAEVRRAHGLPTGSRNLNAIFVGNPGTGKTTVARMMGEILRSTGAVSHGNVLEVGASDITGRYTGHAESNMTRLMKDAEGGVLLIDDAYALLDGGGSSGGGYGRKAMDQLTYEITKERPRPVVVILAGYRNKMEELMKAFNQGLRSRFPHKFEFDDYLPEELLTIFEGMVEKQGYALEDGMKDAVRVELEQRRKDVSFQNARGVEVFLNEEVIPNQGLRIMEAIERDPTKDTEEFVATLTLEDLRKPDPTSPLPASPSSDEVGPGAEVGSASEVILTPSERIWGQYTRAMEKFDRLIGLGPAKEMIKETAAMIVHEADLRASGEIPSAKSGSGSGNHMVFVGGPGTGKTTVAEILAEVLCALEIISDPKPVITSGLGLTGEYTGQTKEKVASLFSEAQGKLIFIDEAYAILQTGRGVEGSDYGREAVDEMVYWMDQLRHRVVVVVAGYPERMDEFLESNPGLPSRFAHRVVFPNYSGDELLEISQKIAAEEGFQFSPEAIEKAREFLARAPTTMPNFANGRTARDLVSQCRRVQAARFVSGEGTAGESDVSGTSGALRTTIEAQDVEIAESRLVGEGRISRGAMDEVRAETVGKLEKELELPARIVEVITQQLDAAIAHAAGEPTIDPAFDLIVVAQDEGRVAALSRVVVGFLGQIGKLSLAKPLDLDGNRLQALSVDAQKQTIERKLGEALGGGLFVKDAHLLSPRALELLVASMTRKDRISIVLHVPDDEGFDKLARRHPLIETEVEASLHLDGYPGDS